MSEIKVNSIKGVSATSAAISINNTDGTASANLTSVSGGQFGNRNMVHNGEFVVSQEIFHLLLPKQERHLRLIDGKLE